MIREFSAVGLPEKVAWFDVECGKTSASHPEWPLKTRTVPFMAGVAFVKNARLYVTVVEAEATVISILQSLVDEGYELRYSATHRYDEAVVSGRWLYVRRGLLENPGPFAHVSGGTYRNLWKTAKTLGWERGRDIASREIPEVWKDATARPLIRLHNLRDVLELVASDPEVALPKVTADEFRRLFEGC